VQAAERLELDALRQNGSSAEHVFIDEGSLVPCPRCGGKDGPSPGQDRTNVRWYCVLETSWERGCDPTRREEGHDACGWRLVLPLPSD
jgi:hypothetical protein